MRASVYVGLDCAETMGVAYLRYDVERGPVAQVTEIVGTPLEQLKGINKLMVREDTANTASPLLFVFEQQHNFRNAITARSLLERQGFLKWTLTSLGFQVADVSPDVARKYLGTGSKGGTLQFFREISDDIKLTDNHTDALAVAVYRAYIDGLDLRPEAISLERITL